MENHILDKSLEFGSLGISHIKSLHFRKIQETKGSMQNNIFLNQLDDLVLDGLDIPISQSIEYLLTKQPTFEEFEEWILLRHDGDICSNRIELINEAVFDFIKNGQQKYPLEIQMDDPIFTLEEMKFWDKNGYIVLKNAVDEEDCKELELAIWNHLSLSPDKPQEWKNTKDGFWLKDFKHPILDKNKSAKKIKRAFTQLWGTDKLITATDRISFNPPLDKNTLFGPSTIHWDISLARPIPLDIFGLLCLNDIKKEQGAFQCIAGFHNELDSWLENLGENINPRKEILSEKYQKDILKIEAKKGDFIMCNGATPHSSSINTSDYPRFIHYIDMYPANRTINPIWK